jgi:hypothetical protein
MKTSKKYWQMKSLTGVILVCIFLTACGGETQEAERKSTVQENETVSTTTLNKQPNRRRRQHRKRKSLCRQIPSWKI